MSEGGRNDEVGRVPEGGPFRIRDAVEADLPVIGWIQEQETRETADDLRARTVVLVDAESGREASLELDGTSLLIRGPFGTTELAPGPALILRAGGTEVLRLGKPDARPLH